MTEDSRQIAFHIPEDPGYLEALGTVSVCHGILDHMLRMTIRTIADLSLDDALDATQSNSSSVLRERARKLARQTIGEGPALLRLEALLERCRRATERRNELIHSIVGCEIDGELPIMQKRDRTWAPLPSAEDVKKLAHEITTLAKELHTARMRGFLAEALQNRQTRSGLE